MKLYAALSWYDEPVDFLYRCVESLAGVADGLVALDGAWELWPDGRAQSPPEQTEAILDGWGRSTDLWLSRLAGRWPSQIAKRDALMRNATALGADWILVVDGDEWVSDCDREALDDLLCATDREVARVRLTHTAHPKRGAGVRRLFRAVPGLGVEVAHNGYGYEGADGKRVWLHGDPAFVSLAPPADASLAIALLHEWRSRGRDRNAASHRYYYSRRRGKYERWESSFGRRNPRARRASAV